MPKPQHPTDPHFDSRTPPSPRVRHTRTVYGRGRCRIPILHTVCGVDTWRHVHVLLAAVRGAAVLGLQRVGVAVRSSRQALERGDHRGVAVAAGVLVGACRVNCGNEQQAIACDSRSAECSKQGGVAALGESLSRGCWMQRQACHEANTKARMLVTLHC